MKNPWGEAPVNARRLFARDGLLRPFRLLRLDVKNISRRYVSDWTLFSQLIFASAVYVFFTNLLPGITFASDLYVLTGQNWGTIEVVLSTGLCGIIFSMYACHFRQIPFSTLPVIVVLRRMLTNPQRFSGQPLTILGVTGPFSILAENIYSLCITSFNVSEDVPCDDVVDETHLRYHSYHSWHGPRYTPPGCIIF